MCSLHLSLTLVRVHRVVEKSITISIYSCIEMTKFIVSTFMCWNQLVLLSYLVQLKLRGESLGHSVYQHSHITAVEREKNTVTLPVGGPKGLQTHIHQCKSFKTGESRISYRFRFAGGCIFMTLVNTCKSYQLISTIPTYSPGSLGSHDFNQLFELDSF